MSTATGPATGSQRAASHATLTEHRDYLAAQATVDHLSDAGFAVEHVAIVGRDLVTFEDVTGRRRYGRAALSGAASGVAIGAFLGLMFALFTIFPTLVSWFVMVLTWAVIGAIAGAVAGLVGHAMQGGRRDFASVSGLTATRYEVLVDPDHRDEALRLLEAGRR
jgi:hypothetical protein